MSKGGVTAVDVVDGYSFQDIEEFISQAHNESLLIIKNSHLLPDQAIQRIFDYFLRENSKLLQFVLFSGDLEWLSPHLVKTIAPIPGKGEHYLSINLEIVPAVEAWRVAKELGFRPEIAKILYPSTIENHALLFFETVKSDPPGWTDLSDAIDHLADRINNTAIRHVKNRRFAE